MRGRTVRSSTVIAGIWSSSRELYDDQNNDCTCNYSVGLVTPVASDQHQSHAENRPDGRGQHQLENAHAGEGKRSSLGIARGRPRRNNDRRMHGHRLGNLLRRKVVRVAKLVGIDHAATGTGEAHQTAL
jgi:hypothetical protein